MGLGVLIQEWEGGEEKETDGRRGVPTTDPGSCLRTPCLSQPTLLHGLWEGLPMRPGEHMFSTMQKRAGASGKAGQAGCVPG